MRRVLIADDDVLVCRFLSQLIDWEGEGYELAGVARDGSRALAMIQETQPQILITDIEMPVMDGIQLVKELRKSGSELKILILSCHDDFAHVKEAMRSGADEYFLKDELTKEKLLELLSSFSEELLEKEEDSKPRQEQSTEDADTREKELLQLLEGDAEENPEMSFDAVLAVRLDDYEEHASRRTSEQREEFYRSFAAMLKEQLPAMAEGEALHVKGGWFVLLAAFQKGCGRQEIRYRLMDLGNRILHQADRHFERSVIIGAAEVNGTIKEAWERAKILTDHSFYENRKVFVSWQTIAPGDCIPKAAEDFARQAEEWLVKRDEEQIRSSFEVARLSFEKEHTEKSLVLSWVQEMDECFGVTEGRRLKTYTELAGLGREYAGACILSGTDQSTYSEGVREAVRYIRENYRSNITLNQAAEEVHLTPAYLSYIFHKETDVTFSEYLQSCRLDHAKELLLETNEKIREVGELVGYNDYRHFCKTFKKAVGLTPQEYRKQGKS